jgi:peptide-methionine (R)-S-oxide reductase
MKHEKISPEPHGGNKQADLSRLDDLQYSVTQEKATERPFTGRLLHNKAKGTYECIVCGSHLFESETKYDSGSGWPSFWLPLAEDRIRIQADHSQGMLRSEVGCAECGAHLGHVFEDGPMPSGRRYCINSAALNFAESKENQTPSSNPRKP